MVTEINSILAMKVFVLSSDEYYRKRVIDSLIRFGFKNIVPYSNQIDCINDIHLKPDILFVKYESEKKQDFRTVRSFKDANSKCHIVMLDDTETLVSKIFNLARQIRQISIR